MARAEATVTIGFTPEDRDLITRILDSQDAEADRYQEHMMQARAQAQDARQLARDAEARFGAQSTRVRQLTTLLETARSVARSALVSEDARITDYQEALHSITQL